ncbi:MAG: hypothetical protein K2X38_16785 [Gemmataceae bacterium]|nr:hypothetical protein [Gemmataceae bacterium]
MRICLFLALLLSLLAVGPAAAQVSETLESVSAAMRPLIVEAMPAVLYEKKDNWGKQRESFVRLVFRGIKPVWERAPKNDGYWKAIKVVPQELQRSFHFKLYDMQQASAEKQSFKAKLGFQAGIEFDHQVWESGVRLFAGNTRARVQLVMDMEVDNIIKIDKDKSGLPLLVFRLNVTKANLQYHDLVVEHTAGVGGSAAKIIGDGLHSAVKQWKPSIERNMLERANSAIVKAADTKEIVVGLTGLVKKK